MPTRRSETDPANSSGRRDKHPAARFLLTFPGDLGIVKPVFVIASAAKAEL